MWQNAATSLVHCFMRCRLKTQGVKCAEKCLQLAAASQLVAGTLGDDNALQVWLTSFDLVWRQEPRAYFGTGRLVSGILAAAYLAAAVIIASYLSTVAAGRPLEADGCHVAGGQRQYSQSDAGRAAGSARAAHGTPSGSLGQSPVAGRDTGGIRSDTFWRQMKAPAVWPAQPGHVTVTSPKLRDSQVTISNPDRTVSARGPRRHSPGKTPGQSHRRRPGVWPALEKLNFKHGIWPAEVMRQHCCPPPLLIFLAFP